MYILTAFSIGSDYQLNSGRAVGGRLRRAHCNQLLLWRMAYDQKIMVRTLGRVYFIRKYLQNYIFFYIVKVLIARLNSPTKIYFTFLRENSPPAKKIKCSYFDKVVKCLSNTMILEFWGVQCTMLVYIFLTFQHSFQGEFRAALTIN